MNRKLFIITILMASSCMGLKLKETMPKCFIEGDPADMLNAGYAFDVKNNPKYCPNGPGTATCVISDKDLLVDHIIDNLQLKTINVCMGDKGGVVGLQFKVAREDGEDEILLNEFGHITS